ncbi:MAG: hypothetical protein O2972_10905, partial [Cyanobacteria bacterium]|nr:hypothetical protein [Cyanobacteriota bacterium]
TVSGSARAHEGRAVGNFELEVGFLHEPAIEGQANAALIIINRKGIDLESYGGAFASGTVETGGSFTFTFGQEFEGFAVPYHEHMSGASGTITVSDSAEISGMAMINFDGDFSPASIEIQPNTSVMFMNMSSSVISVLSGPHDQAAHDDSMAHDHADAGTSSVVMGASATLQVEVMHVPTSVKRVMELRPLVGQDGSYVADFIPTAPGVYTFRFFGEIEGQAIDESFTSGPGSFDEVEPASSVQFPVTLREARELQSGLEGVQSDTTLIATTADNAGSRASTALLIGIIGMLAGISGVGVGAYAVLTTRQKS